MGKVKEVVVLKFLESIVQKLPHRPTDDDESRSLFKKIVSNLQKGDVRKTIVSDLEKYFAYFEEQLVEKEITAASTAATPSGTTYATAGRGSGCVATEESVDRQIQILNQVQGFFSSNGSKAVKNASKLASLCEAFLNGKQTAASFGRALARDALSSAASGSDIIPTLTKASAPDRSLLTLLDHTLTGVLLSVGATGNEACSASAAAVDCLLAYFYRVLPARRWQLCGVLLTLGSSTGGLNTRLTSLLGYVGYWGLVCSLQSSGGSGGAVGWVVDSSSSASSNNKSDADAEAALGADMVLLLLKRGKGPSTSSCSSSSSGPVTNSAIMSLTLLACCLGGLNTDGVGSVEECGKVVSKLMLMQVNGSMASLTKKVSGELSTMSANVSSPAATESTQAVRVLTSWIVGDEVLLRSLLRYAADAMLSVATTPSSVATPAGSSTMDIPDDDSDDEAHEAEEEEEEEEAQTKKSARSSKGARNRTRSSSSSSSSSDSGKNQSSSLGYTIDTNKGNAAAQFESDDEEEEAPRLRRSGRAASSKTPSILASYESAAAGDEDEADEEEEDDDEEEEEEVDVEGTRSASSSCRKTPASRSAPPSCNKRARGNSNVSDVSSKKSMSTKGDESESDEMDEEDEEDDIGDLEAAESAIARRTRTRSASDLSIASRTRNRSGSDVSATSATKVRTSRRLAK